MGTLLDGLSETTEFSLHGLVLPGALTPAPVAPKDRVAVSLPDERYLAEMRAGYEAVLRQHAAKCLTETFDLKNCCSSKSSPAMNAARADFAVRVTKADLPTLLDMLKWASPEKARAVHDAAVNSLAERLDKENAERKRSRARP